MHQNQVISGSATIFPEWPTQRDLIVTLAGRHRLPAVYPSRNFITDGGLISYGPDQIDLYRQAASYVSRILRGEKASDLPVGPQAIISWA